MAVSYSRATATVDPADAIGKFSLTLTSRTNSRPIEDIIVSIHLGEGATSVSATATGDKRMPGVANGSARRQEGVAEGGAGGGTWEFDPHNQVLKWKLSSLVATERAPNLTGSFTSSCVPDVSSAPNRSCHSIQHPLPSPSVTVAFVIQHQSFSGLRIDQLKVTGDVMYKPFKGVRINSKAGRYEVRW